MRDYIIATDSDSELLFAYAQEMQIPDVCYACEPGWQGLRF